jgi:hypothetical protein
LAIRIFFTAFGDAHSALSLVEAKAASALNCIS